jgi:hypothetical protein
MKEIMEIFRVPELSIETKIKVIIKLGRALNDQMGMNWTDEIVAELVSILEDAKTQIEGDENSLPVF